MIQLYLQLKGLWSRVNDYFVWGKGRAPLIPFKDVEGYVNYVFQRYSYRSDPLFGVGDFVTHPERFQWALQNPNAKDLPAMDCDDLATHAFASLRLIAGVYPQIYTLLDSSGKMGHHVICGFTLSTRNETRFGVIDTNGLTWLPDLKPQTICDRWNYIYSSLGLNYTTVEKTEYPF